MKIPWDRVGEAVPAFLTMITMPMTYSGEPPSREASHCMRTMAAKRLRRGLAERLALLAPPVAPSQERPRGCTACSCIRLHRRHYRIHHHQLVGLCHQLHRGEAAGCPTCAKFCAGAMHTDG